MIRAAIGDPLKLKKFPAISVRRYLFELIATHLHSLVVQARERLELYFHLQSQRAKLADHPAPPNEKQKDRPPASPPETSPATPPATAKEREPASRSVHTRRRRP